MNITHSDNSATSERAMHQGYEARDKAYEAAMRDLQQGLPLPQVVRYLRLAYARIDKHLRGFSRAY